MWLDEVAEAVDMVARSGNGHAIFEIAETPYYVQLYLDEPRDVPVEEDELDNDDRHLVIEARSNNYLYGDDERLTAEQEEALERLGWRPPSTACDSRCGCEDEHGNWFRYATLDGIDETGAQLTAVVIAAFGVYGAGENVEVNVAYDCTAGHKGVASCA